MIKIKFGTDGWREKIADDFTFSNVEKLAQATCDVMRKKSRSRLLLVGYDNRFLSKEFAFTVGKIGLANGFKVEVSDQPGTSPGLAYQVKTRKAAVGVMITASHNPSTFSGYKLKGPHGGSVAEDLTQEIESQLENVEIKNTQAPLKESDLNGGYIKWLKGKVKLNNLNHIKGGVVLDSMFGPTGIIFEKLCADHKKVEVIRTSRDPLFGGINPEPIEKNLKFLQETVLRKKAGVGIACDGDGDRVGVVDEKGRYIPPHTVMPLLIQHLVLNRKLKGKIVQTVSMGYLPGRMAHKYKIPFEEVSVGFKYISSKMVREKVILGGEESGGFGVGLWLPERDGVLSGLLLLEMLGQVEKPLSLLIQNLQEEYGRSVFKRVDFPVKEPGDKKTWTETLQQRITEKFGSRKVKKINALDGLKITMEDDSWVLMRPSGTEPLVRTYAEGENQKIVTDLLSEADRLIHLPPPRAHRNHQKSSGKSSVKRAQTLKKVSR